MKKKIRAIVVDGCEYAWAVTEECWPEVRLRVWHQDHRDDPMIDLVGRPSAAVVPSVVADLIREWQTFEGGRKDLTYLGLAARVTQ